MVWRAADNDDDKQTRRMIGCYAASILCCCVLKCAYRWLAASTHGFGVSDFMHDHRPFDVIIIIIAKPERTERRRLAHSPLWRAIRNQSNRSANNMQRTYLQSQPLLSWRLVEMLQNQRNRTTDEHSTLICIWQILSRNGERKFRRWSHITFPMDTEKWCNNYNISSFT